MTTPFIITATHTISTDTYTCLRCTLNVAIQYVMVMIEHKRTLIMYEKRSRMIYKTTR